MPLSNPYSPDDALISAALTVISPQSHFLDTGEDYLGSRNAPNFSAHQIANRHVLRAAIFQNGCRDGEEVGDIGNGRSFTHLAAVHMGGV